MNALKNFTTGPVLSISICNSEHPIAQHASMNAKLIPGSSGIYYIRFKADKYVVTYRKADQSIAIHEMCFAEFKQHWDNKTLPFSEAIDVPETDKYIGNVLWRLLRDELETPTGDIQMKTDFTAAIATNTKVWCRRLEVEFKDAQDCVIAQKLYPSSGRRGPITLAAARASNEYGVSDKRERLIIGCLVADLLIHRLDNNGAVKSYTNANMDAESREVWKKFESVVLVLADKAWANRLREKSTPSIAGMILDAARGK